MRLQSSFLVLNLLNRETFPLDASPGCSSSGGSEMHLLLLSDWPRGCAWPGIALDASLIFWPPVRRRPGATRWALKGAALLWKDGPERAAGVTETGSNASHLLISRK